MGLSPMQRKKPGNSPNKLTNNDVACYNNNNNNIALNASYISKKEAQKDLKIYEELGAGSFGKVYRAYDPIFKQVVAVKMIEMDTSGDIEEVLLELKFLSELRCEYITRYFYSTLHDSVLFVVMEYCAGGSCMHLLKQFSTFNEGSAIYVFNQSLKGLEYIHAQRKIHRDLKSANILVTHDYGIKIADFGVSAQLSRTMPERNSFMGTPYWMAPEVIESETSYSTSVDIWSMGIVMFELLTGSPPHRKLNPTEAMFKIVKEPPPRLYGKWFSRDVMDLVNRCLVKNPELRPSATDLLASKCLQARANSVPNDFKMMIDAVVKRRATKHLNVRPAGVENLNVLAPAKTKHSRIEPDKTSNQWDGDGTYWDFSSGSLDNQQSNIHKDAYGNELNIHEQSRLVTPNIPPRKRPVQQLQQQLQQQQAQQEAQQKAQQESKQQHLAGAEQQIQHVQQQLHQSQQALAQQPQPQQYQPQQPQQPQQKEPQNPHHFERSIHLSPQIAQAWLDHTFTNVESRVSIPRCINRIQRLHSEMNEINRVYPGFTHAFVQEIRRTMR